jgi:hypothetical protein
MIHKFENGFLLLDMFLDSELLDMGSSDVFEGKKLIRAFEFDQVDRPELS